MENILVEVGIPEGFSQEEKDALNRDLSSLTTRYPGLTVACSIGTVHPTGRPKHDERSDADGDVEGETSP